MKHTFKIIEYASFYAVHHIPTGEEHPAGDGVDTVFNSNGNAYKPGTKALEIAWNRALNSNPSETLEAYFPHLAKRDNMFSGKTRDFMKPRLIGYYNEYGYSVQDMDGNAPAYFAGNNRWESSPESTVPKDSPAALDLATIKRFCASTLAEMCREHDAENCGVMYESEDANRALMAQNQL